MAMNDKLQVFPSRANQVLMKQRILAAKRGMGLLKRKRDAIDLKLRDIRQTMTDLELVVDEKMRKAIFSVAKANLLGTDFKPLLVADSKVATAFLSKKYQKIVGVTLPYFDLEFSNTLSFPTAGLSCGGQQVQRVRNCFQDALREIAAYASQEYMLRMLTLASRQTNMRVNALDYVIIPRLIRTHAYIIGELEEYEREDFYRLKRSQAKQLEVKIAFTEVIKTKNMTEEELSAYVKRGTAVHPVADVLFDEAAFNYTSNAEQFRRNLIRRDESRTKWKAKHQKASIDYVKKVAVNRNPRTSVASFVSLHGHTFSTFNISSSSSSLSD